MLAIWTRTFYETLNMPANDNKQGKMGTLFLDFFDFEGFDVSSEVIVERSNMELSHLIFILYLLFLRIETYKRKTEEISFLSAL